MKKIILAIILLVYSVSAQNPNLGTAGAQFLKLPVGARSEAMGGAVVALGNDASSAFWNPSGIAKVNSFQAHFSYMNWFDLFDYDAAALVYNIPEVGAFALSLSVFSTDKIEITTETEPTGTGRFYDAQDLSVGFTYAKFLTDKFNVGLTIKYVRQRIWNETSSGFAFDLGTQYQLDFQNLIIGMSMSNFGADLQYDGPDLNFVYRKNENFPLSRLTPSKLITEEYPLPLSFQVGIGFDVFKFDFVKMVAAIDVVHPNDNKERAHIGTEFSFFDRFYVRGGYKINYDDQDFTIGAGANVPVKDTGIYFDYSYSFYNILPDVQRISVNLSF